VRRLRFWLVLAAVVAVQVWWFQRETPTERRLGAVAQEIARAPVAVRCPSVWGRLLDVSSFSGTAHVDSEGRPTHAELKHEICETFDRIADDGFPADLSCLDRDACADGELEVAEAVHVLAHESWHLAGSFDESVTECYAIQTDAVVAQHLGASRGAALAIARFSWRANPRLALPEYRVGGECRDGGRLDLHGGSAGWPTA
jgi:hypothetical protein